MYGPNCVIINIQPPIPSLVIFISKEEEEEIVKDSLISKERDKEEDREIESEER